jgi:hypothetical protein
MSFISPIQDIPAVDIASLMNSLQGVFFDQNPLLLDAGLDNSVSTGNKIIWA